MRSIKVDWKIQVAYYQKFLFTWISIFFSVLFLIIAFVFESLQNNLVYTIFKGLASFDFVLMAVYSIWKLSFKRRVEHYLFFVFILICFVADIVINIDFVIGMALFFFAHCFYIVASYLIRNIVWKIVPYFFAVYLVVFLTINLLFGFKVFDKSALIWVFTNIYAFALFTSLTYAVIIYIQNRNVYSMYQMIAMLLFAVSDIILTFANFLPSVSKNLLITLNFFILLTYYVGMNLNAINLKKITY